MSSPQLVDLATRVRTQRRIMFSAALAIALVAAPLAYYMWRYHHATESCPSGSAEYTFEGKHDTYFGCTWTGGHSGGWEPGSIWTNRISVGLLGVIAILVVVFFVANWHHSAARYRLQQARARLPLRPQA